MRVEGGAATLGEARRVLNELKEFGPSDRCISLVANQSDRIHARTGVPAADGRKLAAKFDAAHVSTSASSGDGVDDAFVGLVEAMLARRDESEFLNIKGARSPSVKKNKWVQEQKGAAEAGGSCAIC